MPTAGTFRDLQDIPKTIEDVLWDDLEPEFWQRCKEGLELLTRACNDFNEMKTSFYVGAGISVFKPSNLPAAHAVIQSLFDECILIYPNLKKYSSTLEKALEQNNYVLMENIFQHLYECVFPSPFHAGRIFDIPITPPKYNLNHTFLALWLRSGRGTVITPNLDPLIEHAWHQITGLDLNKLTVINRPEQFNEWEYLINQPDVLWKLHGSSDDPESWAITLSRVGFRLEDAVSNFLTHLISTQNICFIGYRAADLDLFPPILDAHTQRKSGSAKIFWVFYFQEGYRTLSEYLQHEPNIAKLFEMNPAHIYPIVTSAERLSAWLQSQCLNIEPILPTPSATAPNYDYRRWFATDIQTIGESATQKLIGYTLRVLGRHDEAIAVLDEAAESILKDAEHFTKADEQLIRQTAQLLQESAQTSWQKKDYDTAIAKVKRAQRLLSQIGDDIGSEFGFVSMIIDAKVPIRWTIRLSALVRLIRLHWRCKKHAHGSVTGFSPVLGDGLCLFYEVKVVEQLLKKTPFISNRSIRLLLIAWYDRAGAKIEESKFLNSIPDIKWRQAALWITIDAKKAVKEMIESIQIAKTISQAHHTLSIERARSLLEQADDPTAKSNLLEVVNEQTTLR
jgi:tetratricopeptide (TPR) repeat protein